MIDQKFELYTWARLQAGIYRKVEFFLRMFEHFEIGIGDTISKCPNILRKNTTLLAPSYNLAQV